MLAYGLALPAIAQQHIVEHVQFDDGLSDAVISHTIVGDQVVDYVVSADAGQRLIVDMTSSNVSAYYDLTGPYAGAAAHVGSIAGSHFDGVLPSAGDWTIRVYMISNAARRNESASFDLSLNVGEADVEVADIVEPDDATIDPAYWRVVDATSIDFLNVRTGPGFGFNIMARVANGSFLRNMGCTGTGLNRWCHVKSDSGRIDGWSNGVRLAASEPPAARDLASLVEHTGGGAVFHQRSTDEFEVQWQSGCTVLYTASRSRILDGENCSDVQLARSDSWAAQQN
ncbi:hypothetical protein SAMN06273572_10931 [Monaibacterium marinum]|uniref:SH3b domain-containing protein n=2 Tax=Pontivivens marinum TaxID=1690039 RepID=A0A2C9CVH7_9RHOB|nr:hypothetical protein SAMN06273572_10931 [Monaibacterium marinum]